MEFYAGVREWTTIITHGDDDAYRQQFEEARSYEDIYINIYNCLLNVIKICT